MLWLAVKRLAVPWTSFWKPFQVVLCAFGSLIGVSVTIIAKVRVLTRVGKGYFRKIHASKILLLNCTKTKYFSHLHVSISGKPRQFTNSIHDLSKIAILKNILTEHTIRRAIPVVFAVMVSVIFLVSFKNSIILWISALRYVVVLNWYNAQICVGCLAETSLWVTNARLWLRCGWLS